MNFANVLVTVKKDQTAKVSSLTRFTVPLLLARLLVIVLHFGAGLVLLRAICSNNWYCLSDRFITIEGSGPGIRG